MCFERNSGDMPTEAHPKILVNLPWSTFSSMINENLAFLISHYFKPVLGAFSQTDENTSESTFRIPHHSYSISIYIVHSTFYVNLTSPKIDWIVPKTTGSIK